MNQEVLFGAFSFWAIENGYKVKTEGESLLITEENGDEHMVTLMSSNDKYGALATNSQRGAEIISEFSEEVLKTTPELVKKVSVSDENRDELLDAIRSAVNDGPDALRKLLERGDFSFDKRGAGALRASFASLKLAAGNDPKKQAMVKRMESLLDMIESMTDDSPKNAGEFNYIKLKNDGKIGKSCRLSELETGDKYFDENKTLYIGVGLEKGNLQGDYINSVVLIPSQDDEFEGKPIKLELNTKVIKVEL